MVRTQLRQARKDAGLSFEGLARKAELSFTTVWQIEQGERDPNLATAQSIARALGTSVDALFPAPTEPVGEFEGETA